MAMKKLDQAARDAGIALSFINNKGESQTISDDTKRALMALMDAPTGSAPPLPPVLVLTPPGLPELTPQGSDDYRWQLVSEQGQHYDGTLSAGESLVLPAELPEGYHQLTLSTSRQQWQTRIIIAPARCYLPPALAQGRSAGARWCSSIRCARRVTGASATLAI